MLILTRIPWIWLCWHRFWYLQVHFRDNGKNIVAAGDFCVEDIIEDDLSEDDGNNTLNNDDDGSVNYTYQYSEEDTDNESMLC